MRTGIGRVDVEPATILPVLHAVREMAQACTEAGWRLTTETPLMPPAFFAATRSALESAATRLHLLALDLEATAVRHSVRLSMIEAAGGVELAVPWSGFADDVGWAGRLAWDRIAGERGFAIAADPVGQKLHAALGAADALLSTWHTASVLLQGTPLYGVDRPGGRAARQELVAMGVNLTRITLPWLALEPEDALAAYTDTVSRVADLPDLQSGDPFRWGGHVGTGLALGKGVDAGLEAATAGVIEGAALPGSDWRGISRSAYHGVSEANKIPTGRPARPRTAAGRAIRAVEDDIGHFVETVVP